MLLTILRHAPPLNDGLLAGRRDIEADCHDLAAMERLSQCLERPTQTLCSPARRCLQTARALNLRVDEVAPELWEQDFGTWEGQPPAALPDLGRLSPDRLARHCPEGGESFQQMAARVQARLQRLDRDTLIVAHAGTARAALAMVVGPAALAFSIAPLSRTILRRAGTEWAVEAVNRT